MIEIRVIGTPAPQGSKKAVGRDKKGRAILAESSNKVAPWRESVKWVAYAEMQSKGRIAGPVAMEVIFTLKKPKDRPKRRVTYPDTYPDLSKCVRSTEDAIVQAGLIEDDARIVECLARKVFPNEHPDALDVPGAVIRIRSVE